MSENFRKLNNKNFIVLRSIIKSYFLIVLMLPCTTQAVSLGKLTLNSYLGQPFKAEIDLVDVNKEEMPSLMAGLASHDTFKQANVDYLPFLFTFEISIENRANGKPYIKITSPQHISEPFLKMLIELKWSSEQLIKEYTILLDPPEDALQPTAPALKDKPAVSNLIKSEPAPIKKLSTSTYGPVKKGDTLAKIALEIAPPRIQLNQILIAMYRVNREAFSGNNMNRLKTGPILRVPDMSEIVAVSPDVADKEVKIQTANWETYRQKLATEVASTAPSSKKSTQTATGRITSFIEGNTPSAKEQSKESLKISKGNGLEKSSGHKTISDQDKLHLLEESAIAREKELSEANERILLLEKNIRDLNLLLKLEGKNTPVTPMEIPEAKQISSVEGKSVEPSSVEMPAVEDEPISLKMVSQQPTIEKSEPPVKSALIQVVVEEPTLIDRIMKSVEPIIDSLRENINYVGAVILLLLTGILGVKAMRRRKEEQFAL